MSRVLIDKLVFISILNNNVISLSVKSFIKNKKNQTLKTKTIFFVIVVS
jgi:hypothetical protein